MRKPTLAILLVTTAAIIAAVVAWLIVPNPEIRNRVISSGRPTIGGPFTLTNQQGQTVTEKDLRGHLTLIYFGYTFCPDVCPTELQTITAAMGQLGAQAKQVTPVFITVDPERDTPEVLQEYLKDFSPRIVGLTGTPEQIAKAAKAYHIYYAKAEGAGTYTMDHTSIVYLMGRDGQYLTHFSLSTPPEAMAAEIRKYL